jgi:hypothetical protein
MSAAMVIVQPAPDLEASLNCRSAENVIVLVHRH